MAENVPTTDPWVRARNRYLEDLDEEEQKSFKTASIENLFYSASASQKDHEMNSKTRVLSRKLEPLVEAIDQYGKALDVFSNTYSLAMSPIWGSIRVVLQIAQAFQNYFEKFLDMFERIGDILPRCYTYQHLFPHHERLLQAISAAYLDIIYFCVDAKKTFRKLKKSTTIHLTWKLPWKNFDKTFEETLNKFRAHVKNVEKEAGVSHRIEASHERELAKADRARKEIERKVQEREAMLSMLSSIHYVDKHLRARKSRHPGSGTWATNTTVFAEWLASEQSTCLWCYGIPGSGKTVLASHFIDTLSADKGIKDITVQQTTSEDIIDGDINSQKLAIVYYYCDFSEHKSLQTSNILATIIKQLLTSVVIQDKIKEKLGLVYKPFSRVAAPEEALDILLMVIEHFSRVFIFIDGLDECMKEERSAILTAIHELRHTDRSKVHILITSQEAADIATTMEGSAHLHISAGTNSRDIASFVEGSIRSNIRAGNLVIQDPSLEKVIVTALVDGAQGMSLWVSFQIADLRDAVSDFEIMDMLHNLPEGMAATYARILQKIGRVRAQTKLSQRIFRWIIAAKRPLVITELLEAIAFGPEDRLWDIKKIPNASRSIQACANLVVFNKQNNTVQLAHHSVRQFLLATPPADSIPEFHFQLSQADLLAGEICVAYLSFADFEVQLTTTERNTVRRMPNPTAIQERISSSSKVGHITSTIQDYKRSKSRNRRQQLPILDLEGLVKLRKQPPSSLRDKYHFLVYAIENWLEHTSSFSEGNSAVWNRFSAIALDKPMAFDIRPWADSAISDVLPHTALFRWAVEEGHIALLMLLDSSPVRSGLEAYFQQAFQGPDIPRCPHPKAVKFLKGKPDIMSYARICLLKAAVNGNDAALRSLLGYLTDPITKSQALLQASYFDHTDAMVTILAHELQLDSKNKCLLPAALEGLEALARLLKENRARFDIMKSEGVTVLHLAVVSGNIQVVRLLLQWRAFKDARRADKPTALHLVAQIVPDTIFAEVLEAGADIEARDAKERTALHLAVEQGFFGIVTQLLTHNANIEAREARSRTALHIASEQNYTKIVNQLLNYNADIEAQEAWGRTALHLACERGLIELVNLLLNHNPDIETRSSNGRTALHSAIGQRSPRLVSQLLNYNADIETRDEEGNTALHIASERGFIEIVNQLLSHNADIKAREARSSGTALHIASNRNHIEVVSQLLKYNADTEARDARSRTALHIASERNYIDVVDQLLNYGADIQAKDENGSTPLQIAIKQGSNDVVTRLSEAKKMRQGQHWI